MITRVGDTDIQPVHKATCHCGAVELALTLPNGIEEPRRCNCSMCRRRGTVVGTILLSDLEIVKGREALQLYRFNTHTARHYFCTICGIHTHHQRRSNPQQYSYNIGCLEGVNPFELDEVTIENGIHHPCDR